MTWICYTEIHPVSPYTQKNKGLKLYLFWVQQLVPGAVPLKGHICTFFTPNRYILGVKKNCPWSSTLKRTYLYLFYT